MFHFNIDGSLLVPCDRCGDEFELSLWDEFDLIVKLVDDPEAMNSNEEDPDVYYIDRNESHISVAAWIYEFINLSFPLQHICALNEKGESTCNQKVIAELERFKANPVDITDKNIWKGLDQFKGLSEDESDETDLADETEETE